MLPVIGPGYTGTYLSRDNVFSNAVNFYGNLGKCTHCHSMMLYSDEVVKEHLKVCDRKIYELTMKRERELVEKQQRFSVSFNGI
jgi:hypothetical protein